MPRQGVPYPSREICSLKCQIDALQRQINELMKSVNGVQGDGQGNLSLISGDPAVVINNDASQNQIEIALDSSQLPAAAVSSVNSQTGAVVLEADDIPSDGNSDVQADIDALKALGVNLQGAINNEVTARGNADSALQGNINTLQASIPGEAAQAVANDPTVQGLVTADAQNVKLSGAQTVGGVKTFTAIPIVPTPAAGSTDGSVPNTNWVSQTGDSAPNNLVHKTGNETVSGVKTFNGELSVTGIDNVKMAANSNQTGWKKLYEWTSGTSNKEALITFLGGTWCTALFVVTNYNNSAGIRALYKQLQSGRADIGVSKNSDGTVTVWQYSSTSQGYARGSSKVLMEHDAWSPASFINVSADNSIYTLDQANMTMTNAGGTVINLDVWGSIA